MAMEADSSFSLYPSSEDEYLEQLRAAVRPGDVEERSLKKRKRVAEPNSPVLAVQPQVVQVQEQDDVYGPMRFGDFGEYMRHKRAKLQIQDADLRDKKLEFSDKPKIFKGLAIYVSS